MERHLGRQPAPVSRPTALVTGTHGRTTVIRLLRAVAAAGGRALAPGDLVEIDPEAFPTTTAPSAADDSWRANEKTEDHPNVKMGY